MSRYRLGKLAPRHDERTLRLASYVRTAELPPVPPAVKWSVRVPKFILGGNDRIGNCGVVGAANLLLSQSANAQAQPYLASDALIVSDYSALTGYDPRTGANDNGVVLLDLLNRWHKEGIAGRKIDGYAAVDPHNWDHLRLTIDLFGGAYVGLALPYTAQSQIGRIWTVPWYGARWWAAPYSWGGHCVCIVDFDATTATCATWGGKQVMSRGFIQAYCDEAYAVFDDLWFSAASKRTPTGLDWQALATDLALLSYRPAA